MAPLVRTGGSRHTGLAALPHRNIHIHTLFDTGHLRISPEGVIELSSRARMDYGASIPPRIVVPDFTNKDFLRWRYENYNGI